MEYKYTPKTKEELISAIEKEIDLQGDDADLNCIDTSAITDMSNLFGLRYGFCCFEGDVSKWNVSKVTDMSGMFFENQYFNGDISQLEDSNVTSPTCLVCFMPVILPEIFQSGMSPM